MHNPDVFKSRFEELRRKKAYETNRNLTLRDIAEESGLSVGTVLRVKNGQMDRVYLSTLDALCRYFDVDDLADLIQYVKDAGPAQPRKKATPPKRDSTTPDAADK